ncbi:MAG: hypothetical protein Fur006_26400 [Coleofasciculaceae cyanobacterium]
MKIQTKESSTFTVLLARPAHEMAETFCQHQSNLQKAEQVYLNTLAVYAVNYYLQCLGFETDWKTSDSWDAIAQTFLDVADLSVKNYGKLECRPVQPDTEVVYIPEEVWEERIGYIAVQLDELLQEATLLGFTAIVSTCEVALRELRSLDELPEYLSQFQSVQPVKESVNLSQWLHNIFEVGWETVEAIFAPPQTELAFNIRSLPLVKASTPEIPINGIKRGKRLDVERQGESQQVAVVVGLTPTSLSGRDITVEVYPLGAQPYLPAQLQVMVLDEQGKSVLQAEAGSSESIEFQFSGEPGEGFSVKLALGDFSITETFFI